MSKEEKVLLSLVTLGTLIEAKFVTITKTPTVGVDGRMIESTTFSILANSREKSLLAISFCPVTGMSLNDISETQIVNAKNGQLAIAGK